MDNIFLNQEDEIKKVKLLNELCTNKSLHELLQLLYFEKETNNISTDGILYLKNCLNEAIINIKQKELE